MTRRTGSKESEDGLVVLLTGSRLIPFRLPLAMVAVPAVVPVLILLFARVLLTGLIPVLAIPFPSVSWPISSRSPSTK